MSTFPVAKNLSPELPFKYVGGDPAIDLVNTVDWTEEDPVDDRLTSYERLTHWAEGAQLLTTRLGEVLRGRARQELEAGQRAHRDALELRWLLRRTFAAIAHDQGPSPEAIGELNETVSRALSRLLLAKDRTRGGALRWGWAEPGEHLDSVLWPIARAAAELLVSDEAGRIRECGALNCGWLYVDRSRNGMRRWCQMEVCGTREKSIRRAGRRARAK